MTDKELRDAAVVELKKTTQGYLKSNGQPRALVGAQWKKGLDLLAQIGAVTPPPTGFPVPTFEVNGVATDNSVFNQAWVLITSLTTPTGDWGGIPTRQLRMPTLDAVNGSWEWWWLYELYIPASWNTGNEGSMYALPCDWHNTPGDIGWSDGSGVSCTHMKFKGNNIILQHEYATPHIYTCVSGVTRDVWHSIAVHAIYGRLDGSVSASGHPNGGKGRTRVYYDGPQVLDTGDISNLQRLSSSGYVQRKMHSLEGMYCPNMGGAHMARYTACRFGRTLAEALGDSNITVRLIGASDTGTPVLKRIADRLSTDFIDPV